MIRLGIRRNQRVSQSFGRPLGPSVSIAFAFLPKLGCPFCWPILAGICSFLGLPFSLLNPILTASTAAATVAVIGLMLRERRITGHASVMAVSLFAILACRLGWMTPWVVYLGGAGLLGAASWSLVVARRDLLPAKASLSAESGSCAELAQEHLCRSNVCHTRYQEEVLLCIRQLPSPGGIRRGLTLRLALSPSNGWHYGKNGRQPQRRAGAAATCRGGCAGVADTIDSPEHHSQETLVRRNANAIYLANQH